MNALAPHPRTARCHLVGSEAVGNVHVFLRGGVLPIQTLFVVLFRRLYRYTKSTIHRLLHSYDFLHPHYLLYSCISGPSIRKRMATRWLHRALALAALSAAAAFVAPGLPRLAQWWAFFCFGGGGGGLDGFGGFRVGV